MCVCFGALATVALGCGGGSGSSGLLENDVIRRVLAEQQCNGELGTDYCPSDATGLLPTGQSIDTALDEIGEFACYATGESEAVCEFIFTFSPDGFDARTSFRVATKRFDSHDPWLLSSPSEVFDLGEDFAGLSTVVVEFEPMNASDDRLQLAVLVFGRQITGLPPTLDVLADSGADLIFVAPPVDALFTSLGDEDAAIDEARRGGQCVDTGITFWCPTETLFAAADDDPTVGVPPFYLDTRVSIELGDGGDAVACVVGEDGQRCLIALAFTAEGLLSLVHRVATRVTGGDPSRQWTVGPDVFHPCYFTGFCDDTDFECLDEEDACVDACAPEFTFECVDECVFTCASKPEFGADYVTIVPVTLSPEMLAGASPRRFSVELAVLPDAAPGMPAEVVDFLEEITDFYGFATEVFVIELVEDRAALARLSRVSALAPSYSGGHSTLRGRTRRLD